jgi:hypothetical protein
MLTFVLQRNGSSIKKFMTTPKTTSPPTHSTSKANDYLARRRERRRNQIGKESGRPGVTAETAGKIAGEKSKSSALPSFSRASQGVQRQEPTEKAYARLSQRRARRRQIQGANHQEETTKSPAVSPESDKPSVERDSANMSEPKKLIVLISNGVSNRIQAANQSRALTLLQAKGTPFLTVDGMDPEQKEKRNELFGISQIRGNYPQFFLEHKDGLTTYVGDWEYIEGLNDSSSLPAETLEDNPEIMTWERVFDNIVESFD